MKGPKIRRRFGPIQCATRAATESGAKPPSRIARQLALAHHIERQVESGEVEGYAQVAEQLGLTRARLTQITNLQLLAPGIQEQILHGYQRPTERTLRPILKQPDWTAQQTTQ